MMRAKLILTLTLFGISGFTFAADESTTKPQAGSATAKEQSAAHPTDDAAAMEEKAGAAKTDADSKGTHSTTGKANSKEARSGAGGLRDWAAIDADRDSSISPDEMQKLLDESWATLQ